LRPSAARVIFPATERADPSTQEEDLSS
jgi:hypothetical protein